MEPQSLSNVQDDTPIPVHTPGSDHSILFEAEGGMTLPTPRTESMPNDAIAAGEDSVPPMDAEDSVTAAPASLDTSGVVHPTDDNDGLDSIEYDPFDRPPNEVVWPKRRKLDEQ